MGPHLEPASGTLIAVEGYEIQLASGTDADRALDLAEAEVESEADQDEDELFALIADEVREPTWLTPILCEFPPVPSPERSITSSPMSTISTLSSHSRSSSSSSSSGFTFSSVESGDSYSSSSSTISQSSCAASPAKVKLSRRERARQARIFVDSTKTAVTNYDGGKTTVLTGGVMLGSGPKPAASTHKKANSSSSSWRSLRA